MDRYFLTENSLKKDGGRLEYVIEAKSKNRIKEFLKSTLR